MKATFRDYSTIILAFVTVFLCGYGVGQLNGKKASLPPPAVTRQWEEETLSVLKDSLDLSSDETRLVEAEIERTALSIRRAREQTIFGYHEKISDLYQRLIEQLGEPHASRLIEEKRTLDETIQKLRPKT